MGETEPMNTMASGMMGCGDHDPPRARVAERQPGGPSEACPMSVSTTAREACDAKISAVARTQVVFPLSVRPSTKMTPGRRRMASDRFVHAGGTSIREILWHDGARPLHVELCAGGRDNARQSPFRLRTSASTSPGHDRVWISAPH